MKHVKDFIFIHGENSCLIFLSSFSDKESSKVPMWLSIYSYELVLQYLLLFFLGFPCPNST